MRREELQHGFCDRSPEDATGGFVAGDDRTGARIARGAAFLSGKPLIAYPRLSHWAPAQIGALRYVKAMCRPASGNSLRASLFVGSHRRPARKHQLAKAGGRDAAGNGRWKIKIEGISQAFFFISTIRADGGYP